MKKVLAFLVAFTFLLGLSVSAFATENTPYADSTTVTINKELTINNSGTVNPTETFNFEITKVSGFRGTTEVDVPDFDTDSVMPGNQNTFSITLAQGILLGSETLDLPEFAGVGVYTYTIDEIPGDTAGMDYDGDTYQLVITVINNPLYDADDDESGPEFLRIITLTDNKDVKDDSFDNDFDAGDLTFEKIVTGNFGSPDDEFEVTVTITPDTGKILKMGPMTFDGSFSHSQDAMSGVITVVYKGVQKGESFTIENIPYDVEYKVEETYQGVNYIVSYDFGEVIDPNDPAFVPNLVKFRDFDYDAKTVTITNNRNILPQTGINLDSLPYILLLSGAIIGMGALFIRKRQNASF